MEIAPRTVIGGYTFHELIGLGAFARVYRVFSARFEREFAAKVFVDDPGCAGRAFDSEVESLMHLNHPNIIRLYDCLHHRGAVILILELCPLGTLEAEILATRGRGLELDRFVAIARQIAAALDVCHAMGVAHRDVKPLNVLFDRYGRAKLADFGVARVRGAAGADGVVGTPAYLAPELWRREPGDPFKADVWALGVVFASMLNGGLPWAGVRAPNTRRGIAAIGAAVCAGAWAVARPLPPGVRQLLDALLRVDPAQRLTAAEIIALPLFAAGGIERVASHCAQPRAQGARGWASSMPARSVTRRRVRIVSCRPKQTQRLP
jgi:serine/threonine protein kinase